MKTARFTEVVAAAGRPQVHALWMAPDRDPELKRAVRDCRVMTLHQQLRGTKKDYGTVGLHLEGSTQVLVFPKPLRRFGDRHIVGIDYKLIQQPDPKDSVRVQVAKPKAAPKSRTAPVRGADSAHAKRELRLDQDEAPVRKKEAAAKPSPPEPPKHPALTRDELLAEIRRALRELKAGKAVAAYERLNAAATE